MKKIPLVILAVMTITGCSIFRREKYGCPSDGRNVGANILLSGDEKAAKKQAKAKFRGGN